MGAIKSEDFDLEFIDRTKKIIENYEGDYNVTLLLNCLLGLIVLPSEFYKRKSMKFFEDDINNYPVLRNLIVGLYFQPTKRRKKGFVDDDKTLKNFIKKIRNGISHQQIWSEGTKDKWTRVIIRDFNVYNNDNLELEVKWTIKQLRTFALFIANSYSDEIRKIQATKSEKRLL